MTDGMYPCPVCGTPRDDGMAQCTCSDGDLAAKEARMPITFHSSDKRDDVVAKLEALCRVAQGRTTTTHSSAIQAANRDIDTVLDELDRIDAASAAYMRVGAARRAEADAFADELHEASTPAPDASCEEKVWGMGYEKRHCDRRARSDIPGLGPRCRQHGDKAIAQEAKNRQRDAERQRHVEGHYTDDEQLVKASAELHDARYAAERAIR